MPYYFTDSCLINLHNEQSEILIVVENGTPRSDSK